MKKSDPISDFKKECTDRVNSYPGTELARAAQTFMEASTQTKYSYNFSWLGRPIIQYPQDIVAIQEIIWDVKPDLIIETGIAHGGSLIFHASLMALLDVCEQNTNKTGKMHTPSKRRVVGIDIDVRPHNRKAIIEHPLSSYISIIDGSSIDTAIVSQVRGIASAHNRVLVILDSNHTHDHVFAELNAYADLTTKGSYCIVLDTIIEDLPPDMYPDRPWNKGNNPKTAVDKWLKNRADFQIDKTVENKLLITVGPSGFLRRTS